MTEHNQEERQNRPLNPQALRLADLAKILSHAGPKPVTIEMLQTDIDAGAPTNTDGTINLIHFTAWLVKETPNGA